MKCKEVFKENKIKKKISYTFVSTILASIFLSACNGASSNVQEKNIDLAVLSTAQIAPNIDHSDAFYSKGRARNFTRQADIVVDNLTQLQWQDNTDTKTLQKSWNEAKTYCLNLSLGGYTNWRLPSVNELLSIIDYGRLELSIDDTFNNTSSSLYWSNTPNAKYPSDAWFVDFSYGSASYDLKSYHTNVRCVRVEK